MTAKKRRRTVVEWVCTCGRCGHEWTSVADAEPKRCASCKDPNWNKPRVRKPRAQKT